MNKIDTAINEELDNLKKEKQDLLNSVSGLESERLQLEIDLQAAQVKFNAKVKEIRAITHPRLYDLDQEIAELTRKLSTHVKPPVV